MKPLLLLLSIVSCTADVFTLSIAPVEDAGIDSSSHHDASLGLAIDAGTHDASDASDSAPADAPAPGCYVDGVLYTCPASETDPGEYFVCTDVWDSGACKGLGACQNFGRACGNQGWAFPVCEIFGDAGVTRGHCVPGPDF